MEGGPKGREQELQIRLYNLAKSDRRPIAKLSYPSEGKNVEISLEFNSEVHTSIDAVIGLITGSLPFIANAAYNRLPRAARLNKVEEVITQWEAALKEATEPVGPGEQEA